MATVAKIKPGDHLVCYLTGVSRLVGVLEAVSDPYRDDTPIWRDEVFPSRIRVKTLIALDAETAIPVHELRDGLSMFQGMKSGVEWTGAFRGSPSKWSVQDGECVVSALEEAAKNPVRRPVDPLKLQRKPKARPGKKVIAATVPEPDDPATEIVEGPERPVREHTEIQWLLLKLGNDMGLDVWVARNDRSLDWQGQKFAELPRLRKELPRQFDDVTNRTIALIDVLWLRENAIVAAFEIESTTQVYSGLLRMSDLLAMQPNISVPLYLVAPDERRNKVVSEINRPTFRGLTPPLAELCRFIPFSVLRERISQGTSFIPYLRPDFLRDVSESCELEIPT